MFSILLITRGLLALGRRNDDFYGGILNNVKKLVGELYKITFRDMTPVEGIIVDYSDHWVLLRSTIDYWVDGYIIINTKGVKRFIRKESELWREKVIKIKYKKKWKKPRIPLDNLESILKALTKKYGIFTLFTKEEGICWLGKLKAVKDNKLTIDDFTPNAKWEGTMTFKLNEIRAIEFDNDYINSLKLAARLKVQK